MSLNIITLIVVLSLTLFTQIIALFLQYIVNRSYKGIGYWLLGSSFIALGFLIMPIIAFDSLKYFAILSNPFIILGYIFLYIGTKNFFSKEYNKWIPISIFIIFNLFYSYYLFVNNSMIVRTIVISIAIAIITFMISYEFLSKKEGSFLKTSNFNGVVFFLCGCFYLIRIFFTINLPSTNLYLDHGYNIMGIVILSIIISNLWTFGFIIMVNQSLNIENQLEKEKLQLIFNTSTNAQLITRLEDGFIVDVNDEFTILSGYSKDELVFSYLGDYKFWNNLEDRNSFLRELKGKNTYENQEFVFQRKDERKILVWISARVFNIDLKPHVISVIQDVTEKKQFEKALIESEEKYRSILNASPDDITITDLNGVILMTSPAAYEIFGYDLEQDNYIGMNLFDFIVPEDFQGLVFNIEQMCKGINQGVNEYRGIKKNKDIFDIGIKSRLIYNEEGLPYKMVFIIRDITKQKSLELQMKKLIEQLEIEKKVAQINSITDSLTGLFNRGYFDNMLRTEFFRLKRSGSQLSLIMLDIDYFKNYNDSYGHLAGDKCLEMIGYMLKKSVDRAQDIVARYGGEEFIIILPETDKNGAKMLGERIRKSVEDLDIPHINSEIEEYVTVSVGIVTIYPRAFKSPDQVLKLVDEALYQAKENGRNRCVYNSNIKEIEDKIKNIN